jgi:hypothetical protein
LSIMQSPETNMTRPVTPSETPTPTPDVMALLFDEAALLLAPAAASRPVEIACVAEAVAVVPVDEANTHPFT